VKDEQTVMAIRKTTRTRTTPAPETPAAPAVARTRRPGAPRRAKRVGTEVPAGVTIAPPTAEEIRVRAYYLSLERGGPSPDPTADWLRAERELVASRAAALSHPGAGS
jgi:Protein of unknown function (DUF2934)